LDAPPFRAPSRLGKPCGTLTGRIAINRYGYVCNERRKNQAGC
jgi:hypothetical protein